MERAQKLIAISAFTRETLVERCGVAREKIATIPHGFEPAAADGVPSTGLVAGPYLYYPAATFPHKNHAELIRSFAVLRRRGALDAKLVFTGMQTPHWRVLARLIRELGLEGAVIHLGFLPHGDVRGVYAGAEAVLFPSSYEGFGIPVLEAAMEHRKKVVTSRLPVFDEIGVPRECQIDFADPDALLAALRSRGATTLTRTPKTWSECARATLAVLRDVAAGGSLVPGELPVLTPSNRP
jgi:glycosyltransferase involved in cell wall biosynthesis